ncbi:hypothetical protein Tco_0927721, partial [Tanacetum coccineum]
VHIAFHLSTNFDMKRYDVEAISSSTLPVGGPVRTIIVSELAKRSTKPQVQQVITRFKQRRRVGEPWMVWHRPLCPEEGAIGHVVHGKSTVVKAISGVQLDLVASFNVLVLCIITAITFSGMIKVGLLGGFDNGSRLVQVVICHIKKWVKTGYVRQAVAVSKAKAKKQAKKEVRGVHEASKTESPPKEVSSLAKVDLISPKQMDIKGFKAQSKMVIDSLD